MTVYLRIIEMTELEKMWAELAKHQPTADKKGYGKAWARMCNERTADAAEAAEAAADAAAYAAAVDADAAYAAYAADAARDAVRAVRYSRTAIDYITKANKGEQA